jgi:hypothetical protein
MFDIKAKISPQLQLKSEIPHHITRELTPHIPENPFDLQMAIAKRNLNYSNEQRIPFAFTQDEI